MKSIKTNNSLTLSDFSVLEERLTQFKALYETLKIENPTVITQYQVKSRPILEASAISTISEYSKKAKEAIDPESTELTDLQKEIFDTVTLLSAKVSALSSYPSLYKHVPEMDTRIKGFISNPELSTNKELLEALKLISQGNALFMQHHRYESVIANKKFMKEIELFLNRDLGITATQCDVVENTLLQLADATLGVQGKASHDMGGDKSRLVFNFKDITKENAEKVVNYCLKMGDETASLGHGYRKHGSSLEKCTESVSLKSASFRISDEPQIKIESHSIEVDGAFFYATILPQLKDTLVEMHSNKSEKITSYQEASKTYLEKKAAEANPKISDNKSTLFQAAQQTSDVTSKTATLSI